MKKILLATIALASIAMSEASLPQGVVTSRLRYNGGGVNAWTQYSLNSYVGGPSVGTIMLTSGDGGGYCSTTSSGDIDGTNSLRHLASDLDGSLISGTKVTVTDYGTYAACGTTFLIVRPSDDFYVNTAR